MPEFKGEQTVDSPGMVAFSRIMFGEHPFDVVALEVPRNGRSRFQQAVANPIPQIGLKPFLDGKGKAFLGTIRQFVGQPTLCNPP